MKWRPTFCFTPLDRNKAKHRLPRFQMHQFIIYDNLLLVQLPVLFVMFWLFCLQRNKEERLKMHRNQKCVKTATCELFEVEYRKYTTAYFIEHFQELFTSLESHHAQLIYLSLLQLHMMASQQEYINILYSNRNFNS